MAHTIQPEAQSGQQHDGHFEQFDQADLYRLFVFVGELPEQGGEQEKGQDEQHGAEVDHLVGVQAGQFAALEDQQGSQGVLEYIVVESPQPLRHEKRHEAPLAEQSELGASRHGQAILVRTPAMVAVIIVASVPPRTALRPSRARSGRRSGASPPMPPIWMAMEEKLAKPHSAYVEISKALGESES